MTCSIIRNEKGMIEKVLAPNGEDSILYKDALAYLAKESNASEKALGYWALAYTPKFRERIYKANNYDLVDKNNEPLFEVISGIPFIGGVAIDSSNRSETVAYAFADPKDEDEKDGDESKTTFKGTPGKGEEMKKDATWLERSDDKESYTDRRTGTSYKSVTTKMPDMTTAPKREKGLTIGQREAADVFKGLPAGHRMITKLVDDKAITEEEYATILDDKINKGAMKGNIIHAEIQEYLRPGDYGKDRLARLYEEADMQPFQFDWLRKNMARMLYYKLDTDYFSRDVDSDGELIYFVNKNAKDKLIPEVTIKSDVLGLAGTIDLLIDHTDDMYSIYDIKTGAGFGRLFEKYFFKYGDTATQDIFDNSRNRAKLQIMMYAIMMKIEDPKARFKNLKAIKIRNAYSSFDMDILNEINVPAFLEMIQKYYETEEKEVWKRLQDLPHFEQIFNPDTYSTTSRDILDKPDHEPAFDLRIKELRLQSLLLSEKNLEAGIASGKAGALDVKEKIAKLMGEIIELKKNKSMSFAAVNNADIGWMDRWLGSPSASTNPYVQLYYKMLQENKNKAEKQYLDWKRTYDALLEKLIKSSGLTSVPGALTRNLIGGVNKTELFKFAYKKVKYEEGDAVIERYVVKEDPEWEKLTKIQQDFLTHVQDGIEQFFEDDASKYTDPRTGKKVALANKVITERKNYKGDLEAVTNLDMYNNGGMTGYARSTQFKYYRGVIPKVAPQLSDIVEKHGYFSKPMLDYLVNKYATFYLESVYENWLATEDVLPLKYLGTREIIEEQAYTLDLDYAVNTFMKEYYYKQELDEVYTFGKAMQIYLQAQAEKSSGDITYEHLTKWFEDSINLHVLGRRQQNLSLSKRPMRLNTSKGFKQVNWVKVLRSLKTFFAGPVMWLKPIAGTANFVFASIYTLKEGLKNSISSRTFADNRTLDFTLSDIAWGFGQAIQMGIKDAIKGDHKDNKLYSLMERYRMFNNNYDWYVENNKLLTAKNKLFSTSSMYFFHSMPEEIISAAIFAAQLRSMKHEGKSLWDHYVPRTYKDEFGNEHTTYEWDGTVRGQRSLHSVKGVTAQYEPITELTPEEISAMKYGYEAIHGGYKNDERIAAEYYIWGELLIQFKKYLPAIIKNGFASKGERFTQGYFKEVKDEYGNTIKQWTPDVIEGRFRVLGQVALTYLAFRFNTKNSKNPVAKFLNLQASDAYKWEKLDVRQKDAVLDAGITLVSFLLLNIGAASMWDRDEEKKSLYKLYDRISRDIVGQWYLPELAKNVVNISSPVMAKKIYKMIESTADLSVSIMYDLTGQDDEAFTKQGNYRGWNEFQRNWHFLSSIHDIKVFLENDENLSDMLDLRLK